MKLRVLYKEWGVPACAVGLFRVPAAAFIRPQRGRTLRALTIPDAFLIAEMEISHYIDIIYSVILLVQKLP